MKTYLKYLLAAAFAAFAITLAAPRIASACDIDFDVVSGEKDKYKTGDELIIKVRVFFTHRNCPEGIDATKFKLDGIKVVGQKSWTEEGTGIYERLLKIKVTDNGKEKSSIEAVRTCDKEGGYGKLTLDTK